MGKALRREKDREAIRGVYHEPRRVPLPKSKTANDWNNPSAFTGDSRGIDYSGRLNHQINPEQFTEEADFYTDDNNVTGWGEATSDYIAKHGHYTRSVEAECLKPQTDRRLKLLAEVPIALGELDSWKQRVVICKRYGFEGIEPRSCESIGKDLGISKQAVSQIEQRAINSLRRSKRMQGIFARLWLGVDVCVMDREVRNYE